MRLRAGTLGIASCLLVCVMAPNPMPEEFVHHFKQGVDGNPMLTMTGPAARTVALPDGQGLRVTLPAKRQKQDPISITPRFTIKGDFEATLSYDFISSEEPLPQSGVGIHFSVKVVGDNPQAVSITRLRKPKGGKQSLNETFGANVITPGPDGKDKYDTKILSATHKSGRLRIERTGEVIKLLAADGPKTPFQEVRSVSIGTGSVESMKIQCMASTGGVDVRFVELVVRAESLGNEPATVTPPSGSSTWIWVAVGVIVIAGVGSVVWWMRSRRRATGTQSPPSAPQPR